MLGVRGGDKWGANRESSSEMEEKARNRRDDQLLVGLKLSLWGRRALEYDMFVRWEVQARGRGRNTHGVFL
jgi:hypothetical protein